MTDIEPYRFEPERRVVDDSSSTEDADSTENLDGDNGRESTEDGERVGNTEWCSCGTCGIMPTGKECLCCQEIDELDWMLHGLRCITQHEDFASVCLNGGVLRTAVVAMVDVRQNSITEPLTCRLLKLTSYRQFTYWVHRKMGREVRRVILSCVVTSIRGHFPEETGEYIGFQESCDGPPWPV
ncbi:uncharacterized protein LOC134197757 [Corticium candelabrum]|uniref:uncharacterized protein LOC134197757 n=1 Tax=Corticium candelabrum TaxID=121492 RepID=UPI002E273053|nr:uncharacterized protein LOC134197757 [Corticium candelabrum]